MFSLSAADSMITKKPMLVAAKQTDSSEKETPSKDESEGATAEESNERCAICIGEVQNPSKIKVCNHIFCKKCLQDLCSSKPWPLSSSCPLCRAKFTRQQVIWDYDGTDTSYPSSPPPTSPLRRARLGDDYHQYCEAASIEPPDLTDTEADDELGAVPGLIDSEAEDSEAEDEQSAVPMAPSPEPGHATPSASSHENGQTIRRSTRPKKPAAAQYRFSSFFPLNSDAVNARLLEAVRKLNLEPFMKCKTIRGACKKFLRAGERAGTAFEAEYVPQGACVVDVPGDGNCMWYSLFALLLGERPSKEAVLAGKTALFDAILANPQLQRGLNFRTDTLKYKGKDYNFETMEAWAEFAKQDGVWGDIGMIQAFSDVTGITVHTFNKEFRSVQGKATFVPNDENNRMPGCQLAAAFVNSCHYQVVVPKQEHLPKRVDVTVDNTEEFPTYEDDSEDVDYEVPSSVPSSSDLDENGENSPEVVQTWHEHLQNGTYVKRWTPKKSPHKKNFNEKFDEARGGKAMKQPKISFSKTPPKDAAKQVAAKQRAAKQVAAKQVAAKQSKSNGTEGMTKPKKRSGSNEDSGNTITFSFASENDVFSSRK